MTLRQAKRLGWTVVELNRPDLVDLGGGLFQARPGKLMAEKVIANQFGHPYTRRIEVATSDPKGWGQLKRQLAAEIEKVEERVALQEAGR